MTTDANLPPSIFEVELQSAPADRKSVFDWIAANLADTAQAHGFAHGKLILWTRATQQDTRLVRAKGFWKLFPNIAMRLPAACSMASDFVVESDGLRFVASAGSGLSELRLLLDAAYSFGRLGGIVLLDRDDSAEGEVGEILDALRRSRSEFEVLQRLRTSGYGVERIVIIPTGWFDDPKVGCLVLAPPDWGSRNTSLHSLE